MSFFATTPLSVAIEAAIAKAEADGTDVVIQIETDDECRFVRPEALPAAIHTLAGTWGSLLIFLRGRRDTGSIWGEFTPGGFEWTGGEWGASVVQRFRANLLSS